MSMKKTFKILLPILFFMAWGGQAFAQVSFTANAPRQVIQGNKFDIKYVLRNATGSNFEEPEVKGAKKLYGPSVSNSSSYEWINGKTSSSSSQVYSIYYIAETAGTYTIEAAQIEADGKIYSTKPLILEIS